MKKTRGLIGFLVVLGLVTIACGPTAAPTSTASPTGRSEAIVPPSEGEAANRKVQVETTKSLTFFPDTLRVEPGETVEFVVADTSGFTHTFTVATSKAKEKILKDVQIKGNETKSIIVTFSEESGKLYLFCRPHEVAGMIGAIEVGT